VFLSSALDYRKSVLLYFDFPTRFCNQQVTGVIMNMMHTDNFRTSSIRKWADMNAKLIRNAMFVMAVIVAISMVGRLYGLG
jgi:hypothetical protein